MLLIAKKCYASGLDLKRWWVVPDTIEEIATAIRHLSEHHDFVFTSGGVGMTIDHSSKVKQRYVSFII
jgi:molybdopterin-biosynthesis enzyme MoeA-like protein